MYLSNFNSICNLHALSVLTRSPGGKKNEIVDIISVMNPVVLLWQPSRELTNDGLSRDTCPPPPPSIVALFYRGRLPITDSVSNRSSAAHEWFPYPPLPYPRIIPSLKAHEGMFWRRSTNLLTSFDVNSAFTSSHCLINVCFEKYPILWSHATAVEHAFT